MRRDTSRAENVDGLRIEQDRRDQAHHDRMSYDSAAAHNNAWVTGDPFRPWPVPARRSRILARPTGDRPRCRWSGGFGR